MVQHRPLAMPWLNREVYLVADLNAAFFHSSAMNRELWGWALGIDHFHFIAARGLDSPPVAHLAAGFSVKRRLRSQQIHFISLNGFRLAAAISVNGHYWGFSLKAVVADKTNWIVQLNP